MSRLLELLKPDETAKDVFSIDFAAEKARGVRGVIFDIDNTLVPHGKPADEQAAAFFRSLKDLGLKACLISNNNEARVKPFAEAVGAFYVHKAGKPGKKSCLKALKEMGCTSSEALLIGDQLFTDILAARRLSVRSILVKPVDESTDPPFVRFKRRLEKKIGTTQKFKKENS